MRGATAHRTAASEARAADAAARPKRPRTAAQEQAAARATRARQELAACSSTSRVVVTKVKFSNDRRWERDNGRVYFKHDDGTKELRFTIKTSRIPGADEGLFAARPYRVNETLTYYTAVRKQDDLGVVGMPKAERALRALKVPEARYVMEVSGRYIVS